MSFSATSWLGCPCDPESKAMSQYLPYLFGHRVQPVQLRWHHHFGHSHPVTKSILLLTRTYLSILGWRKQQIPILTPPQLCLSCIRGLAPKPPSGSTLPAPHFCRAESLWCPRGVGKSLDFERGMNLRTQSDLQRPSKP